MTESSAFLPLSVPVEIAVPDIRRWIDGNAGIPGVWTFTGTERGPHLAITALVHGNEIAGAHVLDRWLRDGIRPARGRLSLAFCNLSAFRRFDPADPTASRFVDEDLNRCWSMADLEARRLSSELRRARELRPFLDTVDRLVDLHSMLWPSDPLILTGETEKAALLAVAIGVPPTIVSDSGHACGRRMIDYARFADPATDAAAVLVEAGPHWQDSTIARMELAAARAMRRLGMARPGDALVADPPSLAPVRRAVVTRTVTAASRDFTFVREFCGGEVIPARNTLIALDGEEEIRTPHDDCLLVMPTPLVPRGHTAVRLARLLP